LPVAIAELALQKMADSAGGALKGNGMLRWILSALFVLAALGGTIGYAARWQMPGLLNVADRLWPGPAGQMVAEAVPYGASPFQQVDVFRPDDNLSVARPVIIFFHGGGWAKGSRDTYGFAGRAFASEGFVTVVAGYRMVPEGRYPVFMEDAATAVQWTRANIAQYGGDPNRIVVAGHSAGAHISLLLALDPRWLGTEAQPGGALRGAISLAGPADFIPFEPGGRADVALGHVRPLEVTQPIHFARADAPPIWMGHGDADVTVRPRNSLRLAAALTDAGGRAEVRLYPGVDHEGTVTPLSLVYRDRIPLLREAVAFARRVTRPQPAPSSR
jgi:acetyl esterase/lipase